MSRPTWRTGDDAANTIKPVTDRPTRPLPKDSGGNPLPSSNPDHLAGTALGPDGLDIGGLLGRGGMGEVRVARDLRLGRDVAVKTARPSDLEAASRLAREAAMTARLEHPNIIPVYMAGTDANGRPWYAMRLLPGRSLDVAIGEATTWTERARLVRHVLGAADALAYAHGRGVLHRDVKPANIMVGAFGETVVADWGLACTLEEAAKPRGTAGTPGFMSPEQAEGQPCDGRTDVYGLGAVLYALCCGKAPPTFGPAPSLRSAAPDVPAEVVTIVERAIARDPEERYPTARAFGDDLLAWFEGRRVAAHDYTPRELLVRFWNAWRVPIAVASVGLLALAIAVSAGWYRTAAARSRALASEARATEAKEAEEQALAAALLGQARTAADNDLPLEAELFAVHSLVRRDTPEARGVVAQFGARPRMALEKSGPFPEGCRDFNLSPDGDRLLCVGTERAWVVDPTAPEVPLAEALGSWTTGDFAGDAVHLALVADDGSVMGWTLGQAPALIAKTEVNVSIFGSTSKPGQVSFSSRGAVYRVDVMKLELTRLSQCPTSSAVVPTLVDAAGQVWAGCDDGQIIRADAGAPVAMAHLRDDDTPPYSMAQFGDELFVGTVSGWAVRFVAGVERGRIRVDDEGIRTFAARGPMVAMSTSAGNVLVWDTARDRTAARLAGRPARLAWLPGGALRIVSDRLEDRRIPEPGRPLSIPFGSGVSGVAISPDGAELAAAVGDGSVVVATLDDGHERGRWKWQDGVAKDVAFDATGTRLAVATAGGPGQRVLSLPDGAIAQELPAEISRRVGFLPSGWLIQAAYRPVINLLLGARIEQQDFSADELEVVGRLGAAVDSEDRIWRIEDGDPPTFRKLAVVRKAIAVCPLGDDTLVSDPDAIVRLGPDGVEKARWPTPSPSRDLACSDDQRMFAAGFLDSSVRVWRAADGVLLARLLGHHARVGSVAFSPDGRWLVSAGWDTTARIWWLGDLETPAEELRDRAVAGWGRSLDELLATSGG